MKRVFFRGREDEFQNYWDALKACGLEPVRSMDLTAAADCDGLLLPGGGDVEPVRYGQENRGSRGIDPERDQAELELIRLFRQLDRPILGICRGHQILNVAFGGTLIQDMPEQDHWRADGVDQVHPVRAVHPVMEELFGTEFVTNSTHHQAVDRLGEGLIVTCRGTDGVVEGLLHENGKILGVQFHPERMAYALRRPDTVDGGVLFRAFRELLEETENRRMKE